MKFLLDTHCLIWFQEDNSKIPAQIMKEIQDTANTILYSQVSLFEIAIKQAIGKLPFFKATITQVNAQAINDGFNFLPIKNFHIEAYNRIPLLPEHRDPFARLLIATAFEENAMVITTDKNFSLYSRLIQVLW